MCRSGVVVLCKCILIFTTVLLVAIVCRMICVFVTDCYFVMFSNHCVIQYLSQPSFHTPLYPFVFHRSMISEKHMTSNVKAFKGTIFLLVIIPGNIRCWAVFSLRHTKTSDSDFYFSNSSLDIVLCIKKRSCNLISGQSVEINMHPIDPVPYKNYQNILSLVIIWTLLKVKRSIWYFILVSQFYSVKNQNKHDLQ